MRIIRNIIKLLTELKELVELLTELTNSLEEVMDVIELTLKDKED